MGKAQRAMWCAVLLVLVGIASACLEAAQVAEWDRQAAASADAHDAAQAAAEGAQE